jgi:Trypsin
MIYPHMKIAPLCLLAGVLASACVDLSPESSPDESASQEGETSHAIHGDGATTAEGYYVARAVKIPGCTATRISARFAITAAHCQSDEGDQVNYYDAASGFSSTRTGRVEQVYLRPGIAGNNTNCSTPGNCIDDSDHFADVALLRLSSDDDADAAGPHATLGWKYPGEGARGHQVGAGGHNDASNPMGRLRQITGELDSNDNDGSFDTVDDQTDGGDSGGPFYYKNQLIGVLTGDQWEPFNHYNLYTSVPEHLDWILSTINFRWKGVPPQPSTKYAGTTLDSFTSTERVCQYACEKTSSCEAYNFQTILSSVGSCQLKTNVTSAVSDSGWRSALRHGASSGKTGENVGYVRSDNYNAVVRRTSNGRVNELYLQNGQWKVGTISSDAPTVESRLSAYVRADGINAVVYRSNSDHIIELALVDGLWRWYDLTQAGGGTPSGDPVAYVRADGVSAVVYRGTNGDIYELSLASRGWEVTNLTSEAGSSIDATSEPQAFARSDGYSSVLFRSGSTIYELYKGAGGGWAISSPSSLASAPAAASRPYGYTHINGINAIVYRSTSSRIIELWLDGAGWHWGDISTGGASAIGNPVAYVRSDVVESVVYRSSSLQIQELTNTPWQPWNLSAGTGAGAATGDPVVYVRKDGVNVVSYPLTGNAAAELSFRLGDTQWRFANLSAGAGETL